MKKQPLKDLYISAWKRGMDSRRGVFSDKTDALREFYNCILQNDGNIITRPPLRDVGGELDSQCQGLVYNAGQFYTFAPRGSTIVNTGSVATTVTVLYFDHPQNATGAWELVATLVFEGNPIAVIRHTYNSTVVTSREMLHVFDNRAGEPTYVSDPAVPTSWTPNFPQWAYGSGTGKSGSFFDYDAVLEANSEKIWMSRPDGNLSFSGIARGRIWNSRTPDDIEQNGAMYYYIMPNTLTTAVFLAPEDSDPDLGDLTRIAGYVLEKLNSDGSWTKIPQDGVPGWSRSTSFPVWRPAGCVRITVDAGAATDGQVLRLRVLVVPQVTTITGNIVSPASEYYTGDGVTYQFPSSQSYYAFSGVVKVNGNTKAATTYYTLTNNAGLARVDFASYTATITPGSNASAPIAATPTIANGGAGYANGNVLTLVGGTFTTAATVTVTSNLAGVITGIALTNPGVYFVLPTNPVAVVGGAGVGATFNVAFAANPISDVNTPINYTAAIDADFATGGATLYLNGIKQTAGYTIVNNGGQARVSFAPPQNINGQSVTLALVPAAGRTVVFDRSGVIVSAGQITYEGAIYTIPQQTTPVLLPLTTYYVAVGLDSAMTPESITIATTDPDPANHGDWRYRHLVLATILTDGAGVITSTTPFQYARELQSPWYVARHQLNLDYFSGEGEAAFINTATHDLSGTTITTMLSVKNRMMVAYPRTTQLWQTDPDPSNLLFIDKYDFGTPDPAVLFYNRPVINTQKGIRAFDLTGLNFQALEDTNIGEALQYAGIIDVDAPAFWPWLGGYMAFGSISGLNAYAVRNKLPADSPLRTGGDVQRGFLYLSFSKESDTLGWSWNPVAGITQVDGKTMIPVENRMYFLSGQKIYYFDAEATSFQDDTDTTPILSRITTHFTHLGSPNINKRFVSLNTVMNGSVAIAGNFQPWADNIEFAWGPTVIGGTFGMPRIPFTGTGPALTMQLSCQTLAGFELQALQIQYIELGRS